MSLASIQHLAATMISVTEWELKANLSHFLKDTVLREMAVGKEKSDD